MKSGGVRRGVQTATVSRKPGSAPDLGRVSRMPGYGRRGLRRRRSRSESYWQQRQQQRRMQLVGWSIGIGVLALAALGVMFSMWVLPRLREGPGQPAAGRAAGAAQVRVASRFKSPAPGEALALVKKALMIRQPDEVAGLIRPGPMTAQEVVDFLEAMKSVDGVIDDYFWLSSVDKNGMSLEVVQVIFAGSHKPRSRLAILTPDSDGVWKLDFAAFARWVEPSWEALLEGQAESGVVRVDAMIDTYFNGPFRDERIWAAYKLTSPDIDEALIGYCKVGSAQQRAMNRLWQRGETAVARVTLEIRRPPSAERVQFEITRVLAEDWVVGDKPLDEVVR